MRLTSHSTIQLRLYNCSKLTQCSCSSSFVPFGRGSQGFDTQLWPQVWAVALKEDSTLLTPATLAKLPVEEAASVAQLCSLLLLQQGRYLDPAASRTVSRLLLAVLLHYAAPVRRAGIKAVGQCLSEKPALAGRPDTSLVTMFTSCLLRHHHLTLLLPCLLALCPLWQ